MGKLKTINRLFQKKLTEEQFFALKTKMRIRAEARTRNFNDNKKNYYWYQIESIDKQYPEYAMISKVKFK